MKSKEQLITSHAPRETLKFGAFLGTYLTTGSVVALMGELGSGKTCLTQGIARGLEVPEHLYVTSPSYTLVNEYHGRLKLFHLDLYRIEDVVELEQIGLDEIMGGDGVTVIEWAEKMRWSPEDDRLSVSISIIDDQTRRLLLRGYGKKAVDLVQRFTRRNVKFP